MNVSLIVKPVIVNLEVAAAMVALSVSTVQELTRTGDFPKPRQTSKRRVGYLVSEIEAWAASRPVSQLPPPPNTGSKKAR